MRRVARIGGLAAVLLVLVLHEAWWRNSSTTMSYARAASVQMEEYVKAQEAADPWKRVPVATTASFRGLSAVTADIVWASGTGGTVIRTVDGGKTWAVRTVTGAENQDFRGIRAFDADNAIIMSTGNAEKGLARIYRTSDGGQNWALVFETKKTGVFFDSIAFWDRKRGVVLSDPVDGHFVLFRTNDGGTTWTQIPPASLPPALKGEGSFAASNSCIALQGERNIWFVTGGASVARVVRSNDGGETWAVADTPIHPANASTGLFSIAFNDLFDPEWGIAVGGDYAKPTNSPPPNVIQTRDGGKTWKALDDAAYVVEEVDGKAQVVNESAQSRSLFLSSVAFLPVRGIFTGLAIVWAVGPAGEIQERAERPWTFSATGNFNALAIPTAETAWAVGPKGFVARLSDR